MNLESKLQNKLKGKNNWELLNIGLLIVGPIFIITGFICSKLFVANDIIIHISNDIVIIGIIYFIISIMMSIIIRSKKDK
jgi:hypothetical protein